MKKEIKKQLIGFFWITGLILAGSDSIYLPIPNFVGVVIIGISNFWITGRKFSEYKLFDKINIMQHKNRKVKNNFYYKNKRKVYYFSQ